MVPRINDNALERFLTLSMTVTWTVVALNHTLDYNDRENVSAVEPGGTVQRDPNRTN